MSEPVSFRLPEDVHMIFMNEINALGGISNSEFFRALLEENYDPNKLDKNRRKDVNKLLYYFNKASNNVNQIARAVNTELLKGGINDQVANKILMRLDLILNSFENGIERAKNE